MIKSPLSLQASENQALKSMVYQHNGFDQITRVNGKQGMAYDVNGNLAIDDLANTYQYDAENRLQAYGSAKGRYQAKFSYYADGSRRDWLYKDTQETAAHQLQFFTTGEQDLNEIDEQGNQASYFLANGKREARVTRIAGKLRVVFYGRDNKDSVISEFMMGSQNKTERAKFTQYDAYGEVVEQKQLGEDKPTELATIAYDGFGYNGEYRDPKQTGGLIYLRARYYAPRLGSFLQRDTDVFMNEYAFVLGNPNGYSDPSGHMAQWLKNVGAWFVGAGKSYAGLGYGYLALIQVGFWGALGVAFKYIQWAREVGSVVEEGGALVRAAGDREAEEQAGGVVESGCNTSNLNREEGHVDPSKSDDEFELRDYASPDETESNENSDYADSPQAPNGGERLSPEKIKKRIEESDRALEKATEKAERDRRLEKAIEDYWGRENIKNIKKARAAIKLEQRPTLKARPTFIFPQ